MNRQLFVGLATCAAVAAVAAALNPTRIFVNGKETTDFIVQDDKLYVAIDALRQAGAEVTTDADRTMIRFKPLAGQNQVDAIEGVIGEWVDNDVWRIQVRNLAEITNPFGNGPGFSLTLEVRNISKSSLSFSGSGLDRIQLVDSKGNILSPAASGSYNKIYDRVPPGAGIVLDLRFGDPQNSLRDAGEAEKLLVLFRSSTKLKNFRIFLKP